MIEIKHKINGKVLYTAENANDVRGAVEEAVKAKANLRSADLRSADLRSANLRYANLRYADLRSANLRYANLGYADLRYANLGSADLRSANLGSADLGSADLGYANLGYADLGSADLRYANLRSANLGSADLRSANLGSADLRSADLGSADLRSADLRSANLGSADLRSADLGYADLGWHHPLWIFQQDFFSILDQAPAEVAGLRATMVDGKIDGSTYEGPCSCLAGTIAAVHGCSVDALDDELGIKTDASRPAEQWFICTQQGDKPIPVEEGTEFETESVFRISVALVWLDKWIESRKAVAAILEPAE